MISKEKAILIALRARCCLLQGNYFELNRTKELFNERLHCIAVRISKRGNLSDDSHIILSYTTKGITCLMRSP